MSLEMSKWGSEVVRKYVEYLVLHAHYWDC